MSKEICTSAVDGAVAWVATAETRVADAIQQHGESAPVGFPDTAYALPIIYSFTGEKVVTLGDMRHIIRRAKKLLPTRPSDDVWLPYLGGALDAGVAALFACEIIEACKYAGDSAPVDGIWLGAAGDVIMRERGIEFVDGTAPGFAAITGAAPDGETAVSIARQLQQKNLYVFMAGCSNGVQFAEQLSEAGVQLGWDTRLVPFGRDVSALVYALGFANRAALSFGGVKPGDFQANLRYNKNRIFAFVLTFGEVSADKYACAAGAINYGFPVVADTPIPQILPSGVCTYEHVVSAVPYDHIVDKALEVRGCKVMVTTVPIPVPFGSAFEGERIRKTDVHVEFGGNKTTAFEFVTMVDMESINDGDITIIGRDIDEVDEGTALPLAIWVEVAGRKMQPDFEPILERQIHHLLNGAEGIWHMGQRDIVWTRISKTGYAKGLRLRHYGEIIHAKFLSDFPAIVDKVRITLSTDSGDVEKRLAQASRIYDERNRRLETMTDESVDTFYSCLLCQSFAPNHVCIITPERLGLCGAYNWLDGRAAYEIDETGPNQPVTKGECLDPVKGIWRGVNNYVHDNSHKSVPSITTYSIMDRPMTSCGCFEVICAYIPECNGIMAVNREYAGDTPVGMTFSTLAGTVGGGLQTPGFMGCGKIFLTSKKFCSADGGHKRLIWMPRELKDMLKTDLTLRFNECGEPGMLDKIADETIGIEPDAVRTFLESVQHPALTMEDMSVTATSAESEEKTKSPGDTFADRDYGLRDTTPKTPAGKSSQPETPPPSDTSIDALRSDLVQSLKAETIRDITRELADALGDLTPELQSALESVSRKYAQSSGSHDMRADPGSHRLDTEKRIESIRSFPLPKETAETPVWTVTLGATAEKGGTRNHTLTIGGETCMPFHLWEGSMPNKPLIAMEVFDVVGPKYPDVLRGMYKNLLSDPAGMAAECVSRYGADLISIRLDGTHPERGARTPDQAIETVRSVLKAVDVPIIVTAHNHFDTANTVLKAVAGECAGENLLLNWVEQDNYRTIAGAALAYGHCLVAQSPIDVNIAKQLTILLTSMNVPKNSIVMDPMSGAVGYGIEYTYSVMERMRLTGLNGDAMLAGPMILSPGYECAKVKEYKAPASDFPAWGDVNRRAACWEVSTALSYLYAGADVLIMYNPEAVKTIRETIDALLESGLPQSKT